ncbi:MAG: STAS domain-containing protein [Planctomycetaceae bacterium]
MVSHQCEFQLEWDDDVLIVSPKGSVESLDTESVEKAATKIRTPLRDKEPPYVVIDLSGLNYFGSLFLSLLLRCHKQVKMDGGGLAICGANNASRDLLSLTALDTLWPVCNTREEAIKAIRHQR